MQQLTRLYPVRRFILSTVFALLGSAEFAQAACPAAPVTAITGSYRTLSVAIPGFENDPIYGDKAAFVYVPSSYQRTQPMPLFIVLHGTAGSPTAAIGQASIFRGLWAGVAEAGGFIVAAPAASGTVGGWIAPINETDTPSDYDVVWALIQRLTREYNVDPTRRYLWGFSSGGHVTLDIALASVHRQLNSEFFAGFGLSAGVSAGLACAGLNAALCDSEVFGKGTSKRPIDVRIGQSDPLWPRALEDRPRFLANGWLEGVTFFWHPFVGVHEVPGDQPLQIWNNLCSFRNRAVEVPVITAPTQPWRIDSQANPRSKPTAVSTPARANPGLRPRDRKR